MHYVKPILRKLLNNPSQISQIESQPGDREMIAQLINMGISKKDIVSAIESYYEVKYMDLNRATIKPNVLGMFGIDMIKLHKFVPFRLEHKICHIAVADLAAHQTRITHLTINRLCQQNNLIAKTYFAFMFEIEDKIHEIEQLTEENNVESVKNISGDIPDDVVYQAEQVIEDGIKIGASDIHLEIRDNILQSRYRVDGILSINKKNTMSLEQINGIISRLKLIAGMDITEKRRPQDGHISDYIYDQNHYDIRVSSVGTIYGEKLVLRLFNKDTDIKDLVALGFSSKDKEKIDQMLNSRYGIIYLGGASGTGKTTTLYTMLDSINSEKVNIYTVEDPVERTLKNVNHIQVNPTAGITFSSVIRSLLRQDPDVVVVGEIRDTETLSLSIRASITGYLVLTTIHANNAVDIISRIFNMGAEPYLVGASTLGFVSQVLVRLLCPHCKKIADPGINETIWLKHLQKKYSGIKPDKFYVPCGCSACNGIGYQGRTAIPEIIVMNDELKNMIIERSSIEDITSKLLLDGYIPLELGALNCAVSGLTSLEEAMKVC